MREATTMRVLGPLLVAGAIVAATAIPADAQSRSNGPRVTIQKAPRSYLTQGPVDRPRSAAEYQASAIYQSGIPSNIGGFQRGALPGPFDLPGFYRPSNGF
jgi:hypothetical protein